MSRIKFFNKYHHDVIDWGLGLVVSGYGIMIIFGRRELGVEW